MVKFRKYQEEATQAIYAHRAQKKPKPGLVVIPTGGGKTHVISNSVHTSGNKALIISPSKEVLEQNYEKYVSLGNEAGIYCAGLRQKTIKDVTYATLASIKKMGKDFKAMGFTDLYLDEAHINSDPSEGMFRTFYTEMEPSYVLGFTATPFRNRIQQDHNGYSYTQIAMMNRTNPKFFSNIIHVTQISELTALNYWSKVDIQEERMDLDGLILNSTGAEFNSESMERINKKNNTNYKIFERIVKQVKISNHILVFLDSVANCKKMTTGLKKKLGDDVVEMLASGEVTTKERTRIVNDFKGGKIKVLCVVDTLTTGFDFPALDCVIMGRPTNSLTTFYQIYGRLVRVFQGKNAVFIDYGMNITRFGRMEDMTIEKYNTFGWGVFNNDRLISGIPLSGPKITKSVLDQSGIPKPKMPHAIEYSGVKITFGKFKDTTIDKIPVWYCQYLKNQAWDSLNDNLKEDVKLKLKAYGL